MFVLIYISITYLIYNILLLMDFSTIQFDNKVMVQYEIYAFLFSRPVTYVLAKVVNEYFHEYFAFADSPSFITIGHSIKFNWNAEIKRRKEILSDKTTN